MVGFSFVLVSSTFKILYLLVKGRDCMVVWSGSEVFDTRRFLDWTTVKPSSSIAVGGVIGRLVEVDVEGKSLLATLEEIATGVKEKVLTAFEELSMAWSVGFG